MTPQPTRVAIAAHRYGLGEASLAVVGDDPEAWLLGQIGPADPQRGAGLVSGAEGMRQYMRFLARLRDPANAAALRNGGADPTMAGTTDGSMAAAASPTPAAQAALAAPVRAIVLADVRARLLTAATTARPFAERMALFWANHFTVSMAKNGARGVVGAYEREAIRPHIAGRFETLLLAAVHHAGMLRYLDNDQSAGPDSPFVRRLAARRAPADTPGLPGLRVSGLNENLAREVLELHTLGVSGGGTAYGGWGGYTQADVTAFAAVLTGWRVPLRELMQDGDGPASRFDARWHQPGPKTVLGKTYAAGPEALDAVLHDLARHPSTARFVCSKLARHFVADQPPPALVARLVAAWQGSDGDLPTVYRSLLQSPEAWAPQAAKLKTPEEFVLSSVRLLGIGEQAFERVPDGGINALGQRVQAAPSPAGWPDQAEEWLGPDAVWKRVEWATRVAGRVGRQVDARQLARLSLGPLLQDDTALQIQRAADGPQALALLLLAPEFQRR